jgi:hypothetical protein
MEAAGAVVCVTWKVNGRKAGAKLVLLKGLIVIVGRAVLQKAAGMMRTEAVLYLKPALNGARGGR